MRRDKAEIEEKPRRRRKKKSRFGYYLYAVVMLVLTIANIVLATFLLTYVQNIKVIGTEHINKQKIVDWIEEDPYTLNSLYAVGKYKLAPPNLPSYLESVKVGWSAPWELRVEVQEKTIVGCILADSFYVYFADDGTVLLKQSEMIEGVPVIEGLQVGKIELYEQLKFKDEKIFSYVVNISEEIRDTDLTPERLVWEEDSMNLYFGEVCVQLGKSNFEKKLAQLPPILEELKGENGTVDLKHYSEMNSGISFERNTEEKTE